MARIYKRFYNVIMLNNLSNIPNNGIFGYWIMDVNLSVIGYI